MENGNMNTLEFKPGEFVCLQRMAKNLSRKYMGSLGRLGRRLPSVVVLAFFYLFYFILYFIINIIIIYIFRSLFSFVSLRSITKILVGHLYSV
jgi:hypothetical protein